MHVQNGKHMLTGNIPPELYTDSDFTVCLCNQKAFRKCFSCLLYISIYTQAQTGVWSPHPPSTPTTSGQEIGWNEQIHRQHAGSCVNQSLARSQRWGCGVAQDDVTENTICQPLSHCLHSLFLVRLYFRNNKTCTYTGIRSPQGICSQTFISVTHHCKSTHTDTHTHTSPADYLSSSDASDSIDNIQVLSRLWSPDHLSFKWGGQNCIDLFYWLLIKHQNSHSSGGTAEVIAAAH